MRVAAVRIRSELEALLAARHRFNQYWHIETQRRPWGSRLLPRPHLVVIRKPPQDRVDAGRLQQRRHPRQKRVEQRRSVADVEIDRVEPRAQVELGIVVEPAAAEVLVVVGDRPVRCTLTRPPLHRERPPPRVGDPQPDNFGAPTMLALSVRGRESIPHSASICRASRWPCCANHPRKRPQGGSTPFTNPKDSPGTLWVSRSVTVLALGLPDA